MHIPRYEVVASDPAHIFTQEEIERILDRFKDNHSIYYAVKNFDSITKSEVINEVIQFKVQEARK